MADYNRCFFEGIIASDPRYYVSPRGSVLSFNLVTAPHAASAAAKSRKTAIYHPMTAYNERADTLRHYLHKGLRVSIVATHEMQFAQNGKYYSQFIILTISPVYRFEDIRVEPDDFEEYYTIVKKHKKAEVEAVGVEIQKQLKEAVAEKIDTEPDLEKLLEELE